MRAAMAAAEVGDEQRREDPTVLALEERAAAFLGQDEAVYLPTATMANQIALAILGARGTELVVEETRAHHDLRARRRGDALGAPDARASGLPRAADGRADPARRFIREDRFHTPRASIVALENTHNSAGGTVWPLDELRGGRRGRRASSGSRFISTARGSRTQPWRSASRRRRSGARSTR